MIEVGMLEALVERASKRVLPAALVLKERVLAREETVRSGLEPEERAPALPAQERRGLASILRAMADAIETTPAGGAGAGGGEDAGGA